MSQYIFANSCIWQHCLKNYLKILECIVSVLLLHSIEQCVRFHKKLWHQLNTPHIQQAMLISLIAHQYHTDIKLTCCGGGTIPIGYLAFNIAASHIARNVGSDHIRTFPNNGEFFDLFGCTLASIKVIVHLKVGLRFDSFPKYQIISSMFQEPNLPEHC